jgi:MFS family permease
VTTSESTGTAASPTSAPLGRSYVYLWSATGSSNLADGILLTGAPLLAVTLTRSPILVALATTLLWLPWLLVSLFAGAAADRHDRRRIMVVATWSRVVLLGLVAALAAFDGLSLPVLYATVFIAGTAAVFSDTSAQSMLPMIVQREQLPKANGRLVAVQTVANQFLGAPLAGILVGVAAAAVFGAVGLCFALAGVLLLRIRGTFRVVQDVRRPMRREIADGLRFLWKHRVLRNLAISSGLFNLGSNAYMAVFVLWLVGSQSQVGLSEAGYGFAVGAVGVGAVVGSLLVERIAPRLGTARTYSLGFLVLSLLLAVPVLVPTPVMVFVAVVPIGACVGIVNVLVVSMRQRMVPPQLLGRVNASYRMIGLGCVPVGAILGGLVAQLVALQASFIAGIALCLIAFGVVARYVTPSAVAAAERAGDEHA